jgi:ribose 5-phosphate isomerase RpiB
MYKLFTTRSLAWLTTLLLAVGPLSAWAQTLTENFDTGTKTSYAAASVTLASGSWTFTDAVIGSLAADKFNGVQAARVRGGSIAMNFDKPNGAGTVTLSAALYGTDATSSFVLEYSTNGGTTYTTVAGAPAALTATLTPYTFTLNQTGNIRLRISNTNTVSGSNPRVNIDDVTITDAAASTTPTVTATPATLTAFTATVGAPSATQTITVGGSALTAGVVVTAPAGYEVSLSATTGFAASVTVPQTGGTAASTPVYVRLTGAATGTYAGNVALTSTGATAVNVAVTGTVSTVAAPAPTITSFTPATGAAGATVTLTGTNFTGATAVTLNGVTITGFTVVNATTITFTVPATGATSGPIAVTTAGGTATSATSFTVTPAAAAPTISSFTPARAVTGVGFTLNVSGTNLVAGTIINFNGVNYTGTIAGSSGASYNVVIPASGVPAPGTYNITATNAGGTSSSLSFLVVAAATSVAYEDFETGSKGAYATGTVTLRSGDWTFTDAVLGNQFNDKTNQVQAARVRGGSIAMNFDKPNGAGTVTLSAAIYGNDLASSLVLEVSSNGGTNYTAVGSPAVLTTTLTPYTFTVNRTGNVRFRISSSNTTVGSNPRINVDDINITNYTGTATLPGQALPGLTVFPNPATDRITVALPTAGAATVALRDLTGRVVLAPAALAADKQVLLPAALAKGVYLLEVRQGDVTAMRRVEKN